MYYSLINKCYNLCSLCQSWKAGYVRLPYGNVNSFSVKLHFRLFCNSPIVYSPWKVLFFGTDDFSVKSLSSLNNERKNGKSIGLLEVVTSVKSRENAVQRYAQENLLKVHKWPPQIQKDEFDIGIVVSFGHLIPERIISSFSLGMLNVHASILPRWRGAAPIIYSILNGDKETGVSVMQIKPYKFDIGGVLKQERISLPPHASYLEVRNKLAYLGSKVLLECIKTLPESLHNIQEQPLEGISYAPRVGPSLSIVKWKNMTSIQVYNLYRALDSVHQLSTKWHGISVKLSKAGLIDEETQDGNSEYLKSVCPGYVFYHKATKCLRVKCNDNKWISFGSVRVSGKKSMSCKDFHNGYIAKLKNHERFFD